MRGPIGPCGPCSAAHIGAVPIACGKYAGRVRLLPAAANGAARAGPKHDWGADFGRSLSEKDLQWDVQLQPFLSEDTTRIEDASVNWPSPRTTLARLTLPRQDTQSQEGQALQKNAEAASFDSWQALAAHRPLGDVQRARKVVYFENQRGRHAV